ncbi:DUF2267 domain-containing protein [Chroococcidiopsis sp. CCALA 051]|uniref:DUF2267 domain-containing protein n=1 Tax=Chroococcidiopsis sp. CCALA 051 TaxID=869949 RepID=UPI000D0DEFDA|nr:DUF2267 domain-containing protein [Chroococcidiopsis sp. CCALA 051]PSM48820.1 DUF2267 domain-containing protein [Chroococcidiopsis sp. CCALA 051]
MKYDEFIKHVQTVAQMDSREDAQRATQATLETIRERIVGNEAKDLASQLPQQLGEYLRGREGEDGQPFSMEEFIKRVSAKEQVEPTVAANHVRAVFAVLQNAVTPGEFTDFKANFSEDYIDLFATGSNLGASAA